MLCLLRPHHEIRNLKCISLKDLTYIKLSGKGLVRIVPRIYKTLTTCKKIHMNEFKYFLA